MPSATDGSTSTTSEDTMAPLRVLTQQQWERYHAEGFLTVPDVFAPAAMDRALEISDMLVYGMDYASWSKRVLEGEPLPLLGDGVSANFPTGHRDLDCLVENETYLDIACDLLGTDDLFYVNGHLFVRAGPSDHRHSEHPWQGFHIDRWSGAFLPPTSQPGYDYIGSGVFLHDVDETCAPTVMIPGSHRDIPRLLPRLHEQGLFQAPGNFSDIRSIPEFTPRATITGRKGSASFNITTLVHGAVPFADRTQQRAWWTMSLGRTGAASHNRLGNAFAYERRGATVPFWQTTTARVRSLFGWPRVGDPYYTQETLALLALWYPAMDLTAYRSAYCHQTYGTEQKLATVLS